MMRSKTKFGMMRVSGNWALWAMAGAVAGAAIFLISGGPAVAGVKLFDAPAPEEEGVEDFPESSFGKPPADPVFGHLLGGKRKAVDAGKGGGRSPASDVVGQVKLVTDSSLVPDRAKGVQEISVIANDLGFFPPTVFVTQDIPVRMYITSASKSTQCLMIDEFAVRKQVRYDQIQEVTFKPTQPGKYRIYCPVNGTEATLVVKEYLSSTARAPASR